jgi:hypothetical protein
MPALTLLTHDPALAVREVADSPPVTRQLLMLTRDRPPGPALDTVLAALRRQVDRLARVNG